MVDPTTGNKFLAQPLRGSDVGVWDTPVNGNFGIIDNSFGGLTTIALTNSPVTLSSGQYQCAFIRFTGAITANVAITFPAVGSFYTIINDCTNSSNFILTALTTTVGTRQIGLPPGSMTQIMTDGSNVRFSQMPPVGTYWDYAGSSTPSWVSACTVPPYVNCDGSAISSATYPALTTLLGGTTLPDLRGRYRVALNQGTGRVTSSGGIDANSIYASGGVQGQFAVSVSSVNLPNYNLNVTDPGHTHQPVAASGVGAVFLVKTSSSTAFQLGGGTGNINVDQVSNTATRSNTTGISVGLGGSATPLSFATLPPSVVYGITMIRAG
jgi:hypothetical protein